ncbi:MAG: BlaI/MecI/CopY family transcriptional regulator [Candidatus Bathyarchaeota archaeon]|nr:BlaI/MecI/CopY family transcriptional regulator [Candidatus Bathyarchaeota archaeon]
MTLIFNPDSDGLSKVFRDYQEEALRLVWTKGSEGVISREVWSQVNQNLDGKTISRASIINFLNSLVDEGVLDFDERTGKGGYHRVYRPRLDENEFKKYLAETVISSLMKDFPTETKEVVKAFAS